MTLSHEFWLQMLVYALSFAYLMGMMQAKMRYIEQKLDRYTASVERLLAVEQSVKSAHKRIDGLEDQLHEKR